MIRLLTAGVVIAVVTSCASCNDSTAKTTEASKGATDRSATEARSPDGGAAKSDHKDEVEEHEELPSRVRLSAAVITKARIQSAAATLEALPNTMTLTGELIADPDRSAKVAVRVQGRIIDVHFKEGDVVKKGDLLATVESPELARARATATSAAAKAASARKNAERLRSIADKGLASGQEVADAESALASVDAESRAARQTLAAFGPSGEGTGESALLQLRAPVAGSVLSRDAIRGETVAPEKIIATIADLSKTYFVARLFEKDLARIKVGSLTEVRLNAYPNEVFSGSVEMVGNQLDPTARTVVARIVVPNRGGLLKVGLFGSATVVVSDATARTPRVVVPLSAITKVADRDVVFVHQPDDDFEMHPVTLGRSAAGRVEVLTGLRQGEKVVIEGVFSLKSAVLKSTFGEED